MLNFCLVLHHLFVSFRTVSLPIDFVSHPKIPFLLRSETSETGGSVLLFCKKKFRSVSLQFCFEAKFWDTLAGSKYSSSSRSLKKSWAESLGSELLLGIKTGNIHQKHMKNMNFSLLVFCHLFVRIISKSLLLLFVKERQERFALLWRARGANCSWSLFKMSDFEQKSEERMSKRVNSQPC